MKFALNKLSILLAAAILLVLPVWAEDAKSTNANSPIQEVQLTVNDIVKAVADYPGETKVKERRAKLREIIAPKFDFEEMSRRSLGSNWNEVSPEEQNEFVKVFSELLAKTYLNRIENVRSDMVKVDSEMIRDIQAIVKTTVVDKGSSFPIDYKLLKKETGWRVYDVVIENIGLVANYRNEFAGIIRKDKFPGLMKRLKEKMEG